MKLELKHLTPYLPYGLNMMYDFENGNVWKLDTTNINAITEYDKPILRPLSDLTKEIEINSKKFIPIYFFVGDDERDDIMNAYYSDKHLETIPYNLLVYLFEWHFDVFGLIPQGLAIDINTI